MKGMIRLFPYPFLVAGLVVGAFGIRNVNRARQSTSWPTVGGTVASSEMGTHRSTDTRRSGRTYSADVSYDYVVDGKRYSSSRVSFGDYSSGKRSHARSILENYPVGKEVTVYYSPGDPALAVLEAGAGWSAYLLLGFGTVFTLAGAGMVILFAKYREQIDAAIEKRSELRS